MDSTNILTSIASMELLTSISQLIMFIGLASTILIYKFSSRLSAFLVIMLCINTLLIVHPVAEVYMLDLAYNDPESRIYVRHGWYWFFALTDIIAVQISIRLCQKWNLAADRFSTYILYAFLAMACIQVLRWLDRIVLETEMLNAFYETSIPLINFSVAAATIGALVLATKNYNKQKGLQ